MWRLRNINIFFLLISVAEAEFQKKDSPYKNT